MIRLDTSVIFDAMKPAPDAAVREWLDEQAAETLYLSSETTAEPTFDIRALHKGRREDRLTARSRAWWQCSPIRSCRSIRRRRDAMAMSP